MNGKHVAILLVVLLVGVAGALLVTGAGPIPVGIDDGSGDEVPTETPSDGDASGDDGADEDGGTDGGSGTDSTADSTESTADSTESTADSTESTADSTESTAEGTDSGDGETTDSPASSDEPPFLFSIDETEECGTTCRDVTATVNNNRNETATGVTVYTRIYAGENVTDGEDPIWEGSTDVGTLEAGGSSTSTERVELSYRDALAVERNDGWITIVTTVDSDSETVTFRDSEQVA